MLGLRNDPRPFFLQFHGKIYFRSEDIMIYLENTTSAQRIYIPLNGSTDGSLNPALTLRSTVNLTEYVPDIDPDWEVTSLYVFLSLRLPSGMQDGSYEYRLSDGERLVSSGCLILGANRNEGNDRQYVKDIEYMQYER